MKNFNVLPIKKTYQDYVNFPLCETFEQLKAVAAMYSYQPEPEASSDLETIITKHIPFKVCQLPSSL